jgi:hypothetical protein
MGGRAMNLAREFATSAAKALLSFGIVFLVATPANAADDKVGSQADAFATAATALASASKDAVDLDRASQRMSMIRTALTEKLLAIGANPSGGAPQIALTNLTAAHILCDVRGNHLLLAAQRNYISATGTQVADVAKSTTIATLPDAIDTLLLKSYSVNITNIPSENTLAEDAKRVNDACNYDLSHSEIAYYGAVIRSPGSTKEFQSQSLIGLITGPAPFISTVSDVITPVLIAAATFKQEAMRRDAVRAFLKSHETELREAGKGLAAATEQYVRAKRLYQAGVIADDLATLRAQKIELSKYPECKDLKSAVSNSTIINHSATPSDQFILCWHASWQAIEKQAVTLVADSDTYDNLADAGSARNVSDQFRHFAVFLTKIKDASRDGYGQIDFQSLWETVTELVTFANTVEMALSPANQQKVKQAIAALAK